jgi:hypothetical protein
MSLPTPSKQARAPFATIKVGINHFRIPDV